VSPLERWSLHASALLTGLSGLAYGWARYFGKVAGEFGLEPHPLQALFQHLHVLAAPLLLFTLGLAVRGHFLAKLRAGAAEGRPSGRMMAVLLGPMALGGYLVQVATLPAWRQGFAWVHGVASLAFLAAYLGHGLRVWFGPRTEGAPAAIPPDDRGHPEFPRGSLD
jgi:hypothetical protein